MTPVSIEEVASTLVPPFSNLPISSLPPALRPSFIRLLVAIYTRAHTLRLPSLSRPFSRDVGRVSHFLCVFFTTFIDHRCRPSSTRHSDDTRLLLNRYLNPRPGLACRPLVILKGPQEPRFRPAVNRPLTRPSSDRAASRTLALYSSQPLLLIFRQKPCIIPSVKHARGPGRIPIRSSSPTPTRTPQKSEKFTRRSPVVLPPCTCTCCTCTRPDLHTTRQDKPALGVLPFPPWALLACPPLSAIAQKPWLTSRPIIAAVPSWVHPFSGSPSIRSMSSHYLQLPFQNHCALIDN